MQILAVPHGGLVAPAVVYNADLWLDASDSTTITESGGSVSQWDNKGSLGNFTQASGALQPTTGVTTLNGLNVIDFAEDYLTSADAASAYKFMHDGTTTLVCMVGKHNGNSEGYLGNNGGASANIGFAFYISGTNTELTVLIARGVSGASSVFANIDPAISNDTFTISTGIYDPDNGTAADRAEIFFNGGSGNKPNTQTNAPSASNPTYQMQIGASGNAVVPMTGSIAEIIVLSGADATEGNRQIVRDYLNEKWSVY